MNRTKRNKPKKKKSRKKNNLNHSATPRNAVSSEPLANGTDFQDTVKHGKSQKRKHTDVVDISAHHNGVSHNKKKRVTFGENSTKVFKNDDALANANGNRVVTATQAFLSLLADTDSHPQTSSRPIIRNPSEAKKEAKKARRAEKKAREKQAKALLNDSKASRMKALESIEDRNIKNMKLKDEDMRLGKNHQTTDPKPPRMDEKPAKNLTNKRKLINPDKEVVPGYKFRDLSEEQINAFLRLSDQKRYDKKLSAKIHLLHNGDNSSLALEDGDRTPITLGDVQHFLIYSVRQHLSTGNLPTWVKLENAKKLQKKVCIVVEGVSLLDYIKNEDRLPTLKSFKYQMEVATPYAYGGHFLTEFLQVPLTNTQRHKLLKNHGSLKEARIAGEAFETLVRIYPQGSFLPSGKKSVPAEEKSSRGDRKKSLSKSDFTFSDPNVIISPPSEDKFPRTELLLRSWDLIKERVPVPFAKGHFAQKYEGFVQTKEQYEEVTDESPIWAIDCEMCLTRAGNELTRISVINENFEVVYESLVKPYNPIVNYLTQYSGITEKDLKNVWTRIEDVQEDLRNLLPSDVILAGHSIGCDLSALRMFHPYVIDTSCIFNLSGIRPIKTKLKTLMAELLYERIQEEGRRGHDSVEDAASCLKLIKAKLARSIEWGDAVLAGKRPESDSVFAQQMLLKKDKEGITPTVYPCAAESIIRCGPRAQDVISTEFQDNKPRVWPARKPIASPNPTISLRDPFGSSKFSKPIINHLVGNDLNNIVFAGNEEFVTAARELAKSKFKVNLPSSPLKFTVLSNSDVVDYGCENAPQNGICFLRLSPDEESDPNTRILQADKLIGAAVKKLKVNSLVTVLLTGRHPNDENDTDLSVNQGVLLMKIFRAAYVPLTIEDISQTLT